MHRPIVALASGGHGPGFQCRVHFILELLDKGSEGLRIGLEQESQDALFDRGALWTRGALRPAEPWRVDKDSLPQVTEVPLAWCLILSRF